MPSTRQLRIPDQPGRRAGQGSESARRALDPLLTVHQVAEFLGLPVQTLYFWRTQGIGPRAYRCGRHLRYDPADVRAWLDSQGR